MNRIERVFEKLKRSKKKAFIAFITAGYPNLSITRELILEFAKSGVDIIELGIPFSDPMADGLIIQEASQKALDNKVNINDVLRMVKKLRQSIDIPICFMTYYNPIFCFGEERFLSMARDSGVDGIIIPDFPPEEGKSFMRFAHRFNVDTIFFIAPTTNIKRMEFISKTAKGFIYYVSLTGVTGPRLSLPPDLVHSVKLVKKIVKKPVCVGFGISTPRQVRQIFEIADGVIVGSAIIKKIKENIGKPDLVKRVGAFVRSLMRV